MNNISTLARKTTGADSAVDSIGSVAHRRSTGGERGERPASWSIRGDAALRLQGGCASSRWAVNVVLLEGLRENCSGSAAVQDPRQKHHDPKDQRDRSHEEDVLDSPLCSKGSDVPGNSSTGASDFPPPCVDEHIRQWALCGGPLDAEKNRHAGSSYIVSALAKGRAGARAPAIPQSASAATAAYTVPLTVITKSPKPNFRSILPPGAAWRGHSTAR